MEILLPLAIPAILFIGFVLFARPWRVWDYRFSPRGVDFVLFHVIPVGRLRRRRIIQAKVMQVPRITSKEFFRFWPHMAAGNRWKKEVLFLRTKGLVRRWVVTPENPPAALAALDAAEDPQKEGIAGVSASRDGGRRKR